MCDRSYGGGGGAFLPHPSMSSPEKGHLNRVKEDFLKETFESNLKEGPSNLFN